MIRIVKEVYTRSREQVGDDYPILIKMNAYDNMKNGLKLEQSVQMAEIMADMGFDGIEVSGIMEDGNAMASRRSTAFNTIVFCIHVDGGRGFRDVWTFPFLIPCHLGFRIFTCCSRQARCLLR